MINRKEYKGQWRTPTSETWYFGTLTFDPQEGPYLEIQGAFGDFMRDGPDVVLGNTDGGQVTLFHCFYRSMRRRLEITTTEYIPSYILEGLFLASIDAAAFSEVQFTMLNLYDWMRISGLSNPFENHRQSEIKFSYVQPDPIGPFPLTPNTFLRIHPTYNVEITEPNSQVHFDQEATASITYTDLKFFEEIIKDVYAIQSFISIAVHEISFIKSLEFIYEDKKYACYFRSPLYKSDYEYKSPGYHLLKYNEIKDDFQNVIINWFTFLKEHENIVHLLIQSLKNKHQISEDKFMDLCRALELFHRSIVKTTPRSNEEHERRVDEILSALPNKKLRNWCKNNLMKNTHTLQARLEELHKKYGIDYIEKRLAEEAKEAIRENEDKAQLVAFYSKISRSRNFYTHYDSKGSENIFEKGGLYQPIKSLKVLLIASIYQHIGLDKNQFEKNFHDATID